MTTRFTGHKTGFKTGKSNDVTPNFMGAPSTTFKGRGGMPEGKLQRTPGAVADAGGGNRRMSKAMHGDGMGSGTNFNGTSAFNSGTRGNSMKARTYNTGGGIGSGFRKGSKTP